MLMQLYDERICENRYMQIAHSHVYNVADDNAIGGRGTKSTGVAVIPRVYAILFRNERSLLMSHHQNINLLGRNM